MSLESFEKHLKLLKKLWLYIISIDLKMRDRIPIRAQALKIPDQQHFYMGNYC
jgi:hypothetical protein